MQEKIESIVKEACAAHGVALYDLEMKPTVHGRLLLVYVTSLGGVKVSDCQRISCKIEHQLEEEDLVQGKYILEVSSPGLERELKKKSHFVSAINEQIKLTVHGEEQNKTLEGRLLEVNPDRITLEYADGEEEEVLLSRIKKAKTLYDYKQDLKKPGKADQKKEKE
ncbi:MAG: ribosome assembly cofactor RimP [Candidatus Cloacimonetes bacterium]|nr:ribosome assembly cofactor RimP [Candidatus Cloacimonadota bacterium]